MITLLMTSLIGIANAQEVPDLFKGSKIERVLADGTVQRFDDTYAIVKRQAKAPNAPLVLQEPTLLKEEKQSSVRLTVLGGSAPSTLGFLDANTVELRHQLVFGGSVQADTGIANSHVELLGLSNGSFMFGIGFKLD